MKRQASVVCELPGSWRPVGEVLRDVLTAVEQSRQSKACVPVRRETDAPQRRVG